MFVSRENKDELIKLDKDIQKSRDARVLKFKNYIEEWEMDRISLKNDKCCSSLLEKYLHMYLYDEGEVCCVVDVNNVSPCEIPSCHTVH